MSDAELAAFQEALGEAGGHVSEFLADGTDQTAEDIEAGVAEYPMPDPLDDRVVNGE